MDDHACLERIRQGGKPAQTAITILYERYARKFHRYLQRRSFSYQESEDILQDAFVRLARLRGRTFTVPDLPLPWLYRILFNCAQDYHRKRPAELRASDLAGHDDDDPAPAPWETRASEPLLAETVWAGVDAALLAFQTDYPEPGTALELVIMEGWSVRELAGFLEKSEGATREYLSYWRKRLQDYLARFCPACFATDSAGDRIGR